MAQPSDAYVTISLDKRGQVIRVEQGGKSIKPRKSKPGQLKRGDSVGECEEIIKVLVHELLTCGKGKGDQGPKDPKDQKDPYTPPGTDPCCYRDSLTGDVYCWC